MFPLEIHPVIPYENLPGVSLEYTNSSLKSFMDFIRIFYQEFLHLKNISTYFFRMSSTHCFNNYFMDFVKFSELFRVETFPVFFCSCSKHSCCFFFSKNLFRIFYEFHLKLLHALRKFSRDSFQKISLELLQRFVQRLF